MMLEIGEIMNLINEAETEEEKIRIIKEKGYPALGDFFKLAFHPDIKWVYESRELPKTEAPEDMPYGMQDLCLRTELRRIVNNFVEGKVQNLKRVDDNAVMILESLHADESKLLAAMISGEPLPVDGLTYDLVRKAVPVINLPERQETEV